MVTKQAQKRELDTNTGTRNRRKPCQKSLKLKALVYKQRMSSRLNELQGPSAGGCWELESAAVNFRELCSCSCAVQARCLYKRYVELFLLNCHEAGCSTGSPCPRSGFLRFVCMVHGLFPCHACCSWDKLCIHQDPEIVC